MVNIRTAYPRIYSPLCKVYWEGWESNTLALQNAGWDISVQEEPEAYHAGMRIAIRNEKMNLYGISPMTDFNYRRYDFENRLEMENFLEFHIQNIVTDYRIIEKMDYLPMSSFNPIDARPTYEIYEPRHIEDFKIFKVVNKDAKQFLIDEVTVPEILEICLQKQEPKQSEIRKRILNEERLREMKDLQENKTVIAEIAIAAS